MNTKILEYYIAAAEEGSISRAAARCYISQPALSQHIRTPEEETGVTLFERKRDGVTLTDCGKIYLNSARGILRTEQQALEKIRLLREQHEHRLRIAVSGAFRDVTVKTILPLLSKGFPQTAVTTLSGDAAENLQNGNADVGVFSSHKEHPSGLESITLHTDHYCLILPRPHGTEPAAVCTALSSQEITGTMLREIIRSQALILGIESSTVGKLQRGLLKHLRIRTGVVYEADKTRTILRMVKNGLGVSLLPSGSAAAAGAGVCLLPLAPAWPLYTLFSHPAAAPLTACGQGFLKYCREYL